MKKLLALLIVVSCLFMLCSCGLAGSIVQGVINAVGREVYKDYEAEPSTFHVGDLAITLTDAFMPLVEMEGMALFSSASGTEVAITQDLFMYSEYPAGLTLEEYAERVKASISTLPDGGVDESVSNISEVTSSDGLVYFTYDYDLLIEYKYMTFVYTSKEALFTVEFFCSEDDFATYEPYFLKWASSVVINSVNQQA